MVIHSASFVATGGDDGAVRVWFLPPPADGNPRELLQPTSDQPTQVCVGHRCRVNCMRGDSTGGRLYSCDEEGIVRVWSARAAAAGSRETLVFECIKILSMACPVRCLALHPSGRQVLVHKANLSLEAIDTRIFRTVTTFYAEARGGEPVRHTPGVTHADTWNGKPPQPQSAAYSPCGTYVFAGVPGGRVFVWNAVTGSVVGFYGQLGGSTGGGYVAGLAFHPSRHQAAVAVWGRAECVAVLGWAAALRPDGSLRLLADIGDGAQPSRERRASSIDAWLLLRRNLLLAAAKPPATAEARAAKEPSSGGDVVGARRSARMTSSASLDAWLQSRRGAVEEKAKRNGRGDASRRRASAATRREKDDLPEHAADERVVEETSSSASLDAWLQARRDRLQEKSSCEAEGRKAREDATPRNPRPKRESMAPPVYVEPSVEKPPNTPSRMGGARITGYRGDGHAVSI
ncbi:Jouberin [Cladochytrium tenue]|nr:Jouberin [Cladochytrium tenue]